MRTPESCASREEERGRAEGRAEGLAKGLAQRLIELVDHLASHEKISVEEACNMLGETYENYLSARELVAETVI